MPEAEDVLIDAAAHATAWVRGVWERGREGDAGAGLAARRRRLEAWQAAWLGRAWPVAAADPPAAPGAISRALRRPPPWRARPADVPTTDGVRIWIPRAWLEGPGAEAEAQRALIGALSIARRLARGEAAPRGDRPARDLQWLVEGARGDRELARDFPGLRGALARLHREALAARPAAARLREGERAVEALVRALLEGPPEGAPEVEALLQRAAAVDVRGYRGVAPVPHWGEPAPAGPKASTTVAPGADASPAGRGAAPPSADLPRPLGRAEDPEAPGRPGPFVLAFGDGHLTVDEPGVLRPVDQGEAEDPEILASEMARLEALPRVRGGGEVREVVAGGESPAAGRPVPDAPAAELAGVTWLYPEWDVRRAGYREPGARVRERPVGAGDPAFAERVMAERRTLHRRLRRQLETLRPRRERLRGQAEGDDVDVGAWVAEWGDRHAGRPPEGRVYTLERRARRDVAVSLLLDASGSTESWLDGRRRIIDVVKEAAIVFGEALAAVGDRHAILAFSGRGAGDVRVERLKRFRESSGPAVRARIGGLEPDAFTRLGAALRHATAGLAREPARVRLLLLLSDGKPQDEDGYEGRYGIEDARQAVAEARAAGVRVFAVTVDREGADYLPRMFGPWGYTVLQDARDLPERLPAIYRRLTDGGAAA